MRAGLVRDRNEYSIRVGERGSKNYRSCAVVTSAESVHPSESAAVDAGPKVLRFCLDASPADRAVFNSATRRSNAPAAAARLFPRGAVAAQRIPVTITSAYRIHLAASRALLGTGTVATVQATRSRGISKGAGLEAPADRTRRRGGLPTIVAHWDTTAMGGNYGKPVAAGAHFQVD
ncbi:hypothetical protein QV65_30945 [Rhodococcus erythropolis]|nr:hypothetical protein QV65_30945 [Rhodococcus erythropolis]